MQFVPVRRPLRPSLSLSGGKQMLFCREWSKAVYPSISSPLITVRLNILSAFVPLSRPGHGGANAVGRGVLSMQGLSYGVVRVDQENSLTSLTLQDCGQVLPGGE